MPELIVEVFQERGQGGRLRLRPLPGQGYSRDTRVAFSAKGRYDFVPGTLIRVDATDVISQSRAAYLRAKHDDFGVVVTPQQADAFIRIHYGQRRNEFKSVDGSRAVRLDRPDKRIDGNR